MISMIKNLLIPLIMTAIPIVVIYFIFFMMPVSGSNQRHAEYCALKTKYLLPASDAIGIDMDLKALKELDNHYTEELNQIETSFGGSFEMGESKIYCIEPDQCSLVNVTAYSPSAKYLYQNIEQLKINPVYYCNTTLMKDTSREKNREEKIMSYSNPELKLHDTGDNLSAINDFLTQAFPLPEGKADFFEYIGYTDNEEGYPNGLYYFYCADFSGYNVNLYAMYFSFGNAGEFATIAYDNMILYGNDLVKCYDSSEKDLFATFGQKDSNINNKLSVPAINLNTIIYNTHAEKGGTLAINQADYLSDEYSVAALYSCNLNLQ